VEKTNTFGGLLKGLLLEAHRGVSSLVDIDSRLDETKGSDPGAKCKHAEQTKD